MILIINYIFSQDECSRRLFPARRHLGVKQCKAEVLFSRRGVGLMNALLGIGGLIGLFRSLRAIVGAIEVYLCATFSQT